MIRALIFRVLSIIQFDRWLVKRSFSRGEIPILLFHRIHPDFDPLTEPCHPDEFEKMICRILSFYEVISLYELIKDPFRKRPACVITFDDATTDFQEYAVPILEKYHVPVTLFVPTEPVNNNSSTWNLRYFGAFEGFNYPHFMYRLRDQEYIFQGSILDLKPIWQLIDELYKLNKSAIEDVINELYQLTGANPMNYVKVLSWSEIAQLNKNLINIQSHSHQHLVMTSLTTKEVIEDLNHSRQLIEENTGQCNYIAFPVGMHDERIIELGLQKYEAIFTTTAKAVSADNVKAGQKVFGRFNISDRSATEVIFRINGLHQWLK